MKEFATILLGAMLLSACATPATREEGDSIPYSNTILIDSSDSQEDIIAKAAHVVPSPNQLAALRNEFIAFVHFGPNTFTGREWGSGMESPSVFALEELDTDQWCRAMKAAGMKMVLLTVKHHDGFVLWQSRYTAHGIMSTGFRDGKGDILADLSASCRKYGLKLGIYLSPADLFQIESPDGLYGNLSGYSLRTIPREVPGRPFKDTRKFEFYVDDYNEYFLNQLFELLTEYGPVHEVWFDGAHPKRKGGQKYNYKAWKELIHTLAPEAVIFGREDVRWCGNEAGATRPTEWNVIPYPDDPDTTTVFPDRTAPDLGSREKLYAGRYLHYQQAETNTSIREGWFWRDDTRQGVRSADDVFDIYERSVGGNSTFLLNIPPNTSGRFSDRDVAVLEEVGRRIEATYGPGTDLLAKAKGPKAVLDDDPDTFYTMEGPGSEFVVTMKKPVTINRIMIQEAVAERGERVEAHAVDAWIDGQWQEIASATNIGYKRILRFGDVTTDRLRFRLLGSRLSPAISSFSAHYYRAGAPQLTISQAADGTVTIAPRRQEFNWKSHGENASANLSAGCRIYYTVDGSEPTEASAEYTAPLQLQPCEVKAIAVLHGDAGAVASERTGYAKAGWSLLGCSSQMDSYPASAAFDADPDTFWCTEKGAMPQYIALDLGAVVELRGFAYTPQRVSPEGMMAAGRIKVSSDGRSWKEAAAFEFGNLVNDPSKRYCYIDAPVTARYVRIEATATEGGSRRVAAAELDIF